MKINRLGFLVVCLVLVGGHWGLAAAESGSKPGKTVRLLTVGNSFSQNATRFLADLASASGHGLIHHQAAIGGATLAQHWEKVGQYETDPKDQRGFYRSKRSLKQELQAEVWDFVTIQQASLRSHDAGTYRPYARQLRDYIKHYAPQAEVLLHETWAYRSDDPRFLPVNQKPGEPATAEAMYQSLHSAYRTIATELGLRLIPVGDAFHLADTDPTWGYRPDAAFDFKQAAAPALPDQSHSLHVGWRWQKQTNSELTLKLDGHHAGAAGQYLGACVFYEVLFGESVVGNPFVPPPLSKPQARFLQTAAHKAVENARADK